MQRHSNKLPDMKKANHPIALERIFFTRTVVISIPEFQPNGEMNLTSAPENSIDVQEIDSEKGRYQVTMRTLLNQSSAPTDPYKIDIECIAILVADDSLTEEEKGRGLLITGHSVLFGAIRETVSWITGRHPYGPMMLGLSILPGNQAESQSDGPKT